MIIEKLNEIKNYGRFRDFSKKNTDWDGVFKKNNIIYAPNGSGKTSFANIFRSLAGDDDLILKRQTFDAENNPLIKFVSNKKEIKFTENTWNRFFDTVLVFDSFYFEDNLYTISVDDKKDLPNLFEIGNEEIVSIKGKIIDLTIANSNISKQINNRKNYLRRASSQKKSYKSDKKYNELFKQKHEIENKVSALQKRRLQLTEEQIVHYMSRVNHYLELFSDSLKLSEIKPVYIKEKQVLQLVYGLMIGEHNITLEERNKTSLKYYLSDGDKNALSLASFLARIDVIPNIKEYIVIIDDPFNSFDTHRKVTTANQLKRISQKVGQFFLLSHDLNFAQNVYSLLDKDVLALKISINNSSSSFYLLDVHRELLTGLNHDLLTIREYASGQFPDDQLHLREVVRCIRPSIEGVFRLKYFDRIKQDQWLGDFIKMIRDSESDSPLYRLKDYLDEIEEINDYSKVYHHSNPNSFEVPINPLELKNYSKRTLKVIEII